MTTLALYRRTPSASTPAAAQGRLEKKLLIASGLMTFPQELEIVVAIPEMLPVTPTNAKVALSPKAERKFVECLLKLLA